MKLEANTAVEEEHRARLEQMYEAGLQTVDGVDAPSRLHNLQQLYSVWNQSHAVQLKSAPPRNPKKNESGGQKDGDFYANVGNAIRTLRVEIPMLFQEDFTCEFSPPTQHASSLLSLIAAMTTGEDEINCAVEDASIDLKMLFLQMTSTGRTLCSGTHGMRSGV